MILQGATDVESRERRMIWVCWGLPLLLMLLPETTRSYGDSGPFCWVKGDTGADQAWRFLIFYLWLWAGVAYIVWVYWKIHQSFKGMDELDPSSVEYQQAVARKATIDRMKYYPMALIVCYFWASIDRLYSSVESNPTSYTLFFLHIMGEATKVWVLGALDASHGTACCGQAHCPLTCLFSLFLLAAPRRAVSTRLFTATRAMRASRSRRPRCERCTRPACVCTSRCPRSRWRSRAMRYAPIFLA